MLFGTMSVRGAVRGRYRNPICQNTEEVTHETSVLAVGKRSIMEHV